MLLCSSSILIGAQAEQRDQIVDDCGGARDGVREHHHQDDEDGEKRFLVHYRLGGRAYPKQHGGSFKTLKEARARRDLITGELAAGRNPADILRTLQTTTTSVVTVTEWGERFLTSRIDIDKNTKKNYKSALGRIAETFGDRDPATITASEIAEWIATMAETRKPGTLNQYLIVFRLLLDHVGLDRTLRATRG